MFSSRFFGLSLPVAALLGLAALPAAAQPYSAAGDFSATSNPNGVWSYGYETTLETPISNTFTQYTSQFDASAAFGGAGNIHGWSANGSITPFVIKNFGADHFTTDPNVDINITKGQLALHPGSDGTYSVVRFTAPAAGTYNLAGSFAGLTNHGTTTDVHILDNGISLSSGNVNSSQYPDPNPIIFGQSLVLNSGDTIDFAVGKGPNDYTYDSTALDATITVAPEPSQVAPFVFLALGLGAMVVLKKKKAGAAA